MATWEFTSEHCSSYDVEVLITKLNERSADGWEVVTIIPTGGDVTAFFRREKPSDDAAEADKPAKDKTEGAFAAGGLDSLKVGIAAAAQDAKDKKDDDKTDDDNEADKAPLTVGASDDHEKVSTLVGDAPSTASASGASTTTTPDPVKEPSGWAVSPDVPASSSPSTPAGASPSVTTPAATSSTVTTPSVSTPASSSPSPWSNSSSSSTTPSSTSSPSVSEPMAPIGGSTSTPASSAPGASTPAPSAPSPAPAPSAPTPAPAPVVTTPAGWYPDPSGRFEMRYWDGQQWTEYVSRAGQQYTDPPVA